PRLCRHDSAAHILTRCSGNSMSVLFLVFFFFNDTATTEIYTLSLHDALPICSKSVLEVHAHLPDIRTVTCCRSEEHTSELQSLTNLVCRLLLEKKKNENNTADPRHCTVPCTNTSTMIAVT